MVLESSGGAALLSHITAVEIPSLIVTAVVFILSDI
jgi:hypothetical protein